jgi:hypothetical protein
VPDPRVHPPQRGDEGPVLGRRYGRDAADVLEGRSRDGQAGAGGLGVARWRIMRLGIQQPGNVVEQGDQPAFQGIVGVQVRRDQCGLRRIDLNPAADHIGASVERGQVAGDPIGRHDRIRIGGQQHAPRPGPLGRQLHRQPPCAAGIGLGWSQVQAGEIGFKPEPGCQGAGSRLGPVGTFVQQQDHRIRAVLLIAQRRQADADTVRFVLRRDGNDSGTSLLMRGIKQFRELI